MLRPNGVPGYNVHVMHVLWHADVRFGNEQCFVLHPGTQLQVRSRNC